MMQGLMKLFLESRKVSRFLVEGFWSRTKGIRDCDLVENLYQIINDFYIFRMIVRFRVEARH